MHGFYRCLGFIVWATICIPLGLTSIHAPILPRYYDYCDSYGIKIFSWLALFGARILKYYCYTLCFWLFNLFTIGGLMALF